MHVNKVAFTHFALQSKSGKPFLITPIMPSDSTDGKAPSAPAMSMTFINCKETPW
jgi:hypothetical protein